MRLIKTGIEIGIIAWVALETFTVIHEFEKRLTKSLDKKYTTVNLHKEDGDGQG